VTATTLPLEFMVGPHLCADFLRDYWNQRSLLVPGQVDRLSQIYDLDGWYAGSGFGDVFAVVPNPQEVAVAQPVGLAEMYNCYEDGTTVCANVTQAPRLLDFLKSITQVVDGDPDSSFAKLYASGTEGGGFPMHFDQHSVFVVQLEGAKSWVFEETPSIQNPLCSGGIGQGGEVLYSRSDQPDVPRSSSGAPAQVPQRDKLNSAILQPGDCLYIPPGTWHQGRAKEHSIALSLSPVGSDRPT